MTKRNMTLAILLAATVTIVSNTKPAIAAAPGAYVELFWPMDKNYNFDIYLAVTDAPSSAIVLFWAHQFHFVGPDGGYIGLQIVGSTRKAIFSIWNAITGSPGQRFTGEGTGWQCLIDYQWKINHPYRLRVWVAGKDQAGNEWWQGAVYEYGGEETIIGTILVPPTEGWLGSWSVTWVEYAGYTTCEAPYTRAVFSKPWARNPLGDHAPQKAKATYGASPCINSNLEYRGSGAYVITAGIGVTRSTPDGKWLWSEEPSLTTIPIPEFSRQSITLISSTLLLMCSLLKFRFGKSRSKFGFLKKNLASGFP